MPEWIVAVGIAFIVVAFIFWMWLSIYTLWMMSDDYEFEMGDTVFFDVDSFNPEYWNGLSMDDKKKYYGDLYDFDNYKPIHFTFITEHQPQTGHCVLINMSNQKVETMRHTDNFRLALEDEL